MKCIMHFKVSCTFRQYFPLPPAFGIFPSLRLEELLCSCPVLPAEGISTEFVKVGVTVHKQALR